MPRDVVHDPFGVTRSREHSGKAQMDDRSAEIVAYAVAFTILVIGGVFLRTAILNWFVGPMTVVATVLILTPLLSRRRPR